MPPSFFLSFLFVFGLACVVVGLGVWRLVRVIFSTFYFEFLILLFSVMAPFFFPSVLFLLYVLLPYSLQVIKAVSGLVDPLLSSLLGLFLGVKVPEGLMGVAISSAIGKGINKVLDTTASTFQSFLLEVSRNRYVVLGNSLLALGIYSFMPVGLGEFMFMSEDFTRAYRVGLELLPWAGDLIWLLRAVWSLIGLVVLIAKYLAPGEFPIVLSTFLVPPKTIQTIGIIIMGYLLTLLSIIIRALTDPIWLIMNIEEVVAMVVALTLVSLGNVLIQVALLMASLTAFYILELAPLYL